MKKMLQRIEHGEHVFLFLDYDGTLVPIQKTPEQASFPPSKRDFLRRLGKRAFVGIVSGRSLSEIQGLIAIKNIAYIGNHGLELSYGQRCWVHPKAKRTEPILKDVLERICHKTEDFPGILVENKRVTGAVHYRLADPHFWTPLKEVVRKEIEQNGRGLKMTEGKRVFEIKPNIPWDKGKGVLKLVDWINPKERPHLIYIGDDQTDEDAFGAVNHSDRNAITIHVGQMNNTQARYRLTSVSQVWLFLKDVLSLITESSGGGT
jgi:trehalose 6-phosphate phosphatase